MHSYIYDSTYMYAYVITTMLSQFFNAHLRIQTVSTFSYNHVPVRMHIEIRSWNDQADTAVVKE